MRIPDSIQKLLIEQGLVPPHCRSIELLMPADGAIVLRYEVYVTTDHFSKFAVVFEGMAASVDK